MIVGKSFIELKFLFINLAKSFGQLRCHQMSSIPGTHMEKEENQLPIAVLRPLTYIHSLWHMHTQRERERKRDANLENIFFIKMYDGFNTAMSSV